MLTWVLCGDLLEVGSIIATGHKLVHWVTKSPIQLKQLRTRVHALRFLYISFHRHRYPNTLGAQMAHHTLLPSLFIRGRWILCFPGSQGLLSPSLCGDPELYVDGAWVPGEIPGSLF